MYPKSIGWGTLVSNHHGRKHLRRNRTNPNHGNLFRIVSPLAKKGKVQDSSFTRGIRSRFRLLEGPILEALIITRFALHLRYFSELCRTTRQVIWTSYCVRTMRLGMLGRLKSPARLDYLVRAAIFVH